jgi:integrase
MASVRERSPGRWQVRAYAGRDPLTGQEIYRSKTIAAAGKRAAQAEANRWELELRDGDLTGDGGTFSQLAAEWLRHAERRMSPSTLVETRRIVRAYLAKPLGAIEVSKITTRTLDVLYAELTVRGGRCRHRPCPRTPCPEPGRTRCQRKDCVHPPCEAHGGACADWEPCDGAPCPHGGPLAVSTVNRIHVVVHAALAQGVRWGWIRRNPAEHANPGQVLEEEIDPPAEVDVIPLLAEVERTDPRLADYLALAIETGARRGALHALRWSYVDLEAGSVRFPRVIVMGADGLVERPASKTKQTGRRPMALSPYTVERLKLHRRTMAERALAAGGTLPADALVFSDDPLGAVPWFPDSTSRKFRLLRGGVGLDQTRLHDLRHLMATLLLSNRVDPKVVAQRGGWSRVATMLDRYAHSVPAADREAAEIMGKVLGGGS